MTQDENFKPVSPTPVEERVEEERYFLAQDQSCHWYVVPVSKKDEWTKWSNIDEDDPAIDNAPDYAEMVGGSYQLVTFTNPKIE